VYVDFLAIAALVWGIKIRKRNPHDAGPGRILTNNFKEAVSIMLINKEGKI
jgi:hypothetical protein